MVDTAKLRGRMAEKGETIASLAAKLGMHPNTLSRRLANSSEFSVKEVGLLSAELGISTSQLSDYFFAQPAPSGGTADPRHGG